MKKVVSAILAKFDELIDELTDEDKEFISDDDVEIWDKDKNAVISKNIAAVIKGFQKQYGGAYFTEFEKDTTEYKLIAINNAQEALKRANKAAKEATEELNEQTIEKIASLTREEALALLEKKWIDPFLERVSDLADAAVDNFRHAVEAVIKKYAATYGEEDAEIRACEQSLADMLGQLHGSEADNLGLAELRRFLGGAL